MKKWVVKSIGCLLWGRGGSGVDGWMDTVPVGGRNKVRVELVP